MPPTGRGPRVPEALPRRLVVLVSGSGTLLQALLDATRDPAYGAVVVLVVADRDGIEGLRRAERAGVPTFVARLDDFSDRNGWDVALTRAVSAYRPDLVVSAGFMKILGPRFLTAHAVVNSHPALLPSFPGAHAVREALTYGVRVTGCTIHLVDEGVDTGPVVAQEPVEVRADDTVETLHERIKVVERVLLVDTVGRLVRTGWTVKNRKVTIP
jgi:phosphoribosylglycinamide formyltransferase 1